MKNEKTTNQTTNAEKRETCAFIPNAPVSNIVNVKRLLNYVTGRADNGDKETLKNAFDLLEALEKEISDRALEIYPSFRLLKHSKRVGEKRYDNLYLQVKGGNPIAIKLAFDNWKVKNMLLANATACEIKQVTLVREEGEKQDTDF